MVQCKSRRIERDEEEGRFLGVPRANDVTAAEQLRHHFLAVVLDRVPIRDELQNIVRESCSEIVHVQESYGYRCTRWRILVREDVEEEDGSGKVEEMAGSA